MNARFLDKFLGGRSSVRVHAPPGGHSSFSFGWGTDYSSTTTYKKKNTYEYKPNLAVNLNNNLNTINNNTNPITNTNNYGSNPYGYNTYYSEYNSNAPMSSSNQIYGSGLKYTDTSSRSSRLRTGGQSTIKFG